MPAKLKKEVELSYKIHRMKNATRRPQAQARVGANLKVESLEPELASSNTSLKTSILTKMDLLELLQQREANSLVKAQVDAEMARRFDSLAAGLVGELRKDDLIHMLRENHAGFGGYEVLKVIFPTCEESGTTPRKRSLLTLMTPLGRWEEFVEFFLARGFQKTNIAGATMEIPALYYGTTIRSCVNLQSTSGTFLDVIESSNHIACLPIFRMPTTFLMHFISPSRLFAPYGRLTCENKAILNSYHTTHNFGMCLPMVLQATLTVLKQNCGVTLHRNPAQLAGNGHAGRCGIHPDCLGTLRSTASKGSMVYTFREDVDTNTTFSSFFNADGILWRLGGWSCYANDTTGVRSYLALAPDLHTHYDGQMKGQAVEIQSNKLARRVLGWN